jgi:hypothetical protein
MPSDHCIPCYNRDLDTLVPTLSTFTMFTWSLYPQRWNSWTSIGQENSSLLLYASHSPLYSTLFMNCILQNGKMRVKTLESEKTRVYAQKPRLKMQFKNSICVHRAP